VVVGEVNGYTLQPEAGLAQADLRWADFCDLGDRRSGV
jgi:hypothetical protein